MLNGPKISIVTICLNEKDTIEDTFLSILKQSYKNIEMVVIDGGSTDGTLDIIKKYQDKIAYFVSEPDSGLYNAMNRAIDAASGDFVYFLNANDTLFDKFILTKVAKCINDNPDARFIFGDIRYLKPNGDLFLDLIEYNNQEKNLLFIKQNLCHQAIFYDRTLFDDFGKYSEKLKIHSDTKFNIECLFVHKVKTVYIPTIIANFRWGGLSSCKKNENLSGYERLTLLKQYFPKTLAWFNLSRMLIIFKNYHLFFDKLNINTYNLAKFFKSKIKHKIKLIVYANDEIVV